MNIPCPFCQSGAVMLIEGMKIKLDKEHNGHHITTHFCLQCGKRLEMLVEIREVE